MKWLFLLILFVVGCGGGDKVFSNSGMDGDADSNKGGSQGSDTDFDFVDTGEKILEGDEVCDSKAFSLEPVLGRLMILQDLSHSMFVTDSANPNTPNKWDQSVNALTSQLKNYRGMGLEFGFDIFPDGSDDPSGQNRCGVTNPVLIDSKVDNENVIIEELGRYHEFGATPLYCGMNNFTDPDYAPQFLSGDIDKVLVVVTDGQDNCSDDCMEGTALTSDSVFGELSRVLRRDHGVKSIAVGFGKDVDEGQLNAITQNGGTGFAEFVRVDSKQDLERALGLITGLIIKCVFKVADLEEDADPASVNFYFDGEVVPYDEGCAGGQGWNWTSKEYNEVSFCDESCTKLQSDEVKEVTAKFGCTQVML